MNFKKVISSFCVAGMLLTALPGALAADAPAADSVSEYAGQTIGVTVVSDTGAGGAKEYVIDVAIPDGASQDEANDRLITAARAVANGGAAPRFVIPYDSFIRGRSNITLTSSTYDLGTSTLSEDFSQICAVFQNISANNGATQLNFRIEGNGAQSEYNAGVILSTECVVYIAGGSRLSMDDGTVLSFFASTNTGSVDCSVLIGGMY